MAAAKKDHECRETRDHHPAGTNRTRKGFSGVRAGADLRIGSVLPVCGRGVRAGRARSKNLTGQECVILQQLMFTPKPRSVSDLSRFSNRDDVSNIQYSLRKLIGSRS